MLKSFIKRLKLEKILQGSIYALGGLLLTSSLLIAIFQILKLTAWYFYLIALGGGLLTFVIILLAYYFAKKIKEKDAAKRVDSNFDLHEKASTMVEFEGKSGFLIEKQREDAKKCIKHTNPKKLAIKLTMASLVFPLIGGGAFATSFFTNNIVNAFTFENDDNFDNDTDKIIDNIKEYIGKSQASAAFKEKLYKILEDLREDLKGDVSIPSRREKVNKAKEEVDVALDEVNTKEEIGEALLKEDNDFTEVGAVVSSAEVEKLEAVFKNFTDQLNIVVSTTGLLALLGEWINNLKDFFKGVDIPKTDANYNTFKNLLTKLQAVHDNVEQKLAASSNASNKVINQLITSSQEQVRKAIEEVIKELKTNLTLEKGNDELAKKVKDLMDQLIDPNSEKKDNTGTEEGGNGKPDGEEGDAGDKGNEEIDTDKGDSGNAEGGKGDSDGENGDGSGSGDGGKEGEGDGQGKGDGASGGGGSTKYGSNDKVYTGENGQTAYGDVIGDYQNGASDDAKGTGDDDLEGAIGDYFDELYGDADRKSNP